MIPASPQRSRRRLPPLSFLRPRLAWWLCFGAAITTVPAQTPTFRSRMPVEIAAGTQVVGRDKQPLRTARTGEVMTVGAVEGDQLWCVSSVPGLVDGFVPARAATPVPREALIAWSSRAGTIQAELGRAALAETSAQRTALEAKLAEKEAAQTPKPTSVPVPAAVDASPVLGYLDFADRVEVNSITATPSGDLLLMGLSEGYRGGSLKLAPRRLSGEPIGPADYPREVQTFILRLDPSGRKATDLVLISDLDVQRPSRLRADAEGNLFLAARSVTGWAPTREQVLLAGDAQGQPGQVVIKYDPDLRQRLWVYGIPKAAGVFADLQIDGAGRSVCLLDHAKRFSVPQLLRLWAGGAGERPWRKWRDGTLCRIDFRVTDAEFGDGPLAPWVKGTEVYPHLGTPMAKFGAPDNTGQPIRWTNASGGKNPIPLGSASLVAQQLAVGRDGSVVVSATLPFVEPAPDFEPVLMRFSPEGRLQWTSVLIEGLLSEPDQKSQALRIDPSNGDILVTYWEHGENVNTLIKDPAGFLSAYGGKSGNLKASWVGRVEAATGRLKASTYLFGRSVETVQSARPQVTSVAIQDMGVDAGGRVYVTGSGLGVMPTTDDARLPVIPSHGGRPYLTIFTPDLHQLCHSTYLSLASGRGDLVEPLANGSVLVAGSIRPERSTPMEVIGVEGTNYLGAIPPASAGPPPYAFISLLKPELSPKPARWRIGPTQP